MFASWGPGLSREGKELPGTAGNAGTRLTYSKRGPGASGRRQTWCPAFSVKHPGRQWDRTHEALPPLIRRTFHLTSQYRLCCPIFSYLCPHRVPNPPGKYRQRVSNCRSQHCKAFPMSRLGRMPGHASRRLDQMGRDASR
ncbi:hypothetical protein BC834DRAFT_679897 [Gloeopeniophorella convolvens]|nr:hypothetical protein BC834DRAFT_679897 [Gloeopeniophorella convolvens]